MDQVEALAGQQAVPPASNNAAKGRSTANKRKKRRKEQKFEKYDVHIS